ncbi:MAG TPA: GNAT family N-acetyltransferase [Lachnospiraceae bacterium]|nr:GNAT family N-acetyltransferase [Lachnospiraceae bacterium]
MELIKTKKQQIDELVKISKEAFDSDILVGAAEAGGPPEYDSVPWHMEMMKEGHLFTAVEGNEIVGGALLFKDEHNSSLLYVGRIFMKPSLYRKGYGMKLMELIESDSPDNTIFKLDTPIWNVRTNRFYKKVGYVEESRDQEFIYYQKERK